MTDLSPRRLTNHSKTPFANYEAGQSRGVLEPKIDMIGTSFTEKSSYLNYSMASHNNLGGNQITVSQSRQMPQAIIQ